MGCVEIGPGERDPDCNSRFEKSREGLTLNVTRSEEKIQVEEIKLAEIKQRMSEGHLSVTAHHSKRPLTCSPTVP